MKLTQDLVILPNRLEQNVNAEIYYSGNTNSIKNLYIEYSNLPFENENTIINRVEMIRIESSFYASIHLTDKGSYYFRLIDNNNNLIISDSKQTFEVLVQSSTNNSENNQNNNSELEENNTTNTETNQNINSNNKESIQNSLSLIPIKEQPLIYAKKGIRLSYRINKRIRLILYKLFRKLPSFITGNYRRRINL